MQYSVIIPVFNSEQSILEMIAQTNAFFSAHPWSYEIILVDDGSTDGSWKLVKELAQKDPHITAIHFRKNYGQHTAVFCGLLHSKGAFIITLDDDLQNPPGEVIKLINKINEGYDLVFGKYEVKQHSLLRKTGSRFIGFLNRIVYKKPAHITLSNFRIFNRRVADKMKKYDHLYPYIPGLLLISSGKMANVQTIHAARVQGHSNYSPDRILRLVLRLVFMNTPFSIKVLQWLGFKLAGKNGFVISEIVSHGA